MSNPEAIKFLQNIQTSETQLDTRFIRYERSGGIFSKEDYTAVKTAVETYYTTPWEQKSVEERRIHRICTASTTAFVRAGNPRYEIDLVIPRTLTDTYTILYMARYHPEISQEYLLTDTAEHIKSAMQKFTDQEIFAEAAAISEQYGLLNAFIMFHPEIFEKSQE